MEALFGFLIIFIILSAFAGKDEGCSCMVVGFMAFVLLALLFG